MLAALVIIIGVIGLIVAGYGLYRIFSLCYQLGVEDGYGHARHPNSCLYSRAGAYLKRKFDLRWPELTGDYREKNGYHGFLWPADRSVVEDLEKHEIVYAKDQKQYIPLRVLRSQTSERKVMSRWSPNSVQRRAIFAGADIFLSLLTFEDSAGRPNPLQPTQLVVANELDPEEVRSELKLKCPRCNIGIDDDGDGNCAFCSRLTDEQVQDLKERQAVSKK